MDEHFYGEWVFVDSEDKDELDEAYEYLRLWKKFIIKKLEPLEFIEETIILRERWPIDTFKKCNPNLSSDDNLDTLCIKLHMKGSVEECINNHGIRELS